MASLDDRLDRETETWLPETEGDKVVGTVVALDHREALHAGEVPVVVVETDDGREVEVWGLKTVLKNEVYRLDPHVGDRFGAKYLGQKTPHSGGKPYHAFKVVLERGAGGGEGLPTPVTQPAPVEPAEPAEPAAPVAAPKLPKVVPAGEEPFPGDDDAPLPTLDGEEPF